MINPEVEEARVDETLSISSNEKPKRGRPKGSFKGKPVEDIIKQYGLPNSADIKSLVIRAVRLEKEGFAHNSHFYKHLPEFYTALLTRSKITKTSIDFKIVFLSFNINLNRQYVADKCNSRQVAACFRNLRNKGFLFGEGREDIAIVGFNAVTKISRGNHHTPEGRTLFLQGKRCNLFGSDNPTDVEHRIPENICELYSIAKPPKLTEELYRSGKADIYYQAATREANQTKERHGCGPCISEGVISGPHGTINRDMSELPPCINGKCQWSNPEKYRNIQVN